MQIASQLSKFSTFAHRYALQLSMAKTQVVQVRLTEQEKEALKQVAQLAGIPLSSWVRERLRKACIKELEEAGRPIPFLKSVSFE